MKQARVKRHSSPVFFILNISSQVLLGVGSEKGLQQRTLLLVVLCMQIAVFPRLIINNSPRDFSEFYCSNK